MKKILIAATAATMMLGAVAAHAEGTMGGLGFRTLSGPANTLFNSEITFGTSPAIGIRQWFTEQLGVDVGVGFTSLSVEAGGPQFGGAPADTKFDEGTGFVIDIGIPFAAKKWDKVNFIVRPGFLFGTAKAKDKVATAPPDELTSTTLSVSGELEVEYMLTEKLSISAAHGIAYRSVEIKDNDTPESKVKVSGFETSGDNFTQLGFHVYLW